jgi:hypothetical protein
MTIGNVAKDLPFDCAGPGLVIVRQPFPAGLQLVILFKRNLLFLDRPRPPRADQATSPQRWRIRGRSLDVRDRSVHTDEERPLGAGVPGQFGQLGRGEIGVKVGRIRHAISLVEKQSDGKDRGER